MRATLTFDLNDPDDQQAHRRAIKSTDLALALWEIWHEAIKKTERAIESEEIKCPFDALDTIRVEIGDIMSQRGIVIDDLIS